MSDSVRAKARKFDGKYAIYAFRFKNGITKVGMSSDIVSRTRKHLANGITGCEHVEIVECDDEKHMRAAEKMAHLLWAAATKQTDRETFETVGQPLEDLSRLQRSMAQTRCASVKASLFPEDAKPVFNTEDKHLAESLASIRELPDAFGMKPWSDDYIERLRALNVTASWKEHEQRGVFEAKLRAWIAGDNLPCPAAESAHDSVRRVDAFIAERVEEFKRWAAACLARDRRIEAERKIEQEALLAWNRSRQRERNYHSRAYTAIQVQELPRAIVEVQARKEPAATRVREAEPQPSRSDTRKQRTDRVKLEIDDKKTAGSNLSEKANVAQMGADETLTTISWIIALLAICALGTYITLEQRGESNTYSLASPSASPSVETLSPVVLVPSPTINTPALAGDSETSEKIPMAAATNDAQPTEEVTPKTLSDGWPVDHAPASATASAITPANTDAAKDSSLVANTPELEEDASTTSASPVNLPGEIRLKGRSTDAYMPGEVFLSNGECHELGPESFGYWFRYGNVERGVYGCYYPNKFNGAIYDYFLMFPNGRSLHTSPGQYEVYGDSFSILDRSTSEGT